MAGNKNKELVKLIGRQLRTDPELGAPMPPCTDIELQLDRLRAKEAQSHAPHPASTEVDHPASTEADQGTTSESDT